MLRLGGQIALTVRVVPAPAGQVLLRRAVEAAGLTRPSHVPVVAEDDFPRDPDGLAALMASAGLREARCETLH